MEAFADVGEADEMQEGTLGNKIRDARLAKSRGLRELAKEMGITPSYLSDIELDRRIPAEDVMRKIATMLELDVDHLLAAAGRFGKDVEIYMKRNPSAGVLFRRIADWDLGGGDIRDLVNRVDEIGKDRREGQPRTARSRNQ